MTQQYLDQLKAEPYEPHKVHFILCKRNGDASLPTTVQECVPPMRFASLKAYQEGLEFLKQWGNGLRLFSTPRYRESDGVVTVSPEWEDAPFELLYALSASGSPNWDKTPEQTGEGITFRDFAEVIDIMHDMSWMHTLCLTNAFAHQARP